ncbi:MAG: VWA domain-containing protein [Pseudomonadota bacterium]
MAKRRELNVFSLSFLDIMSCGFGAVILIFILIQHSTEVTSQTVNLELMAEVTRLEEEVLEGTERLAQVRNTLAETEDEIITTEGRAALIVEQIRTLESRIAAMANDGASQTETIDELKQELQQLAREAASLEGSVGGTDDRGTSLRSFVGDGNRQYLTGLNVGGTHILILLDGSGSMLDETIVNAVRRNLMADADKLESPKWQRALSTVEWIMANMPPDSSFQLMTFNTDVHRIAQGDWQASAERTNTDAALLDLKKFVPGGGTSLFHAFSAAAALEPRPDNIFLIIDSLPTQGERETNRTAISSQERVRLFTRALNELPQNIPVNIILFPMEGDPMATPYFWILAQASGGAFLTPSKDWP